MSVEQFVNRWRLGLGFFVLTCGWMSVFLGDIFGIILVVLCIVLMIAGLMARGPVTNPAARFRDRPFGEKILIIAAAATLIGASVAYYHFGWIKDLGSVIIPVNVVLLLVSPTAPAKSESQI